MRKRFVTVGVGLAFAVTVAAAQPATATEASTMASVVTCNWRTPEYPHISSYAMRSGTIEIKTSTQGSCNASSDPLLVTAELSLEKSVLGGLLWTTAIAGPPITKSIQGTPQTWQRNELVAAMPCVPGTYRGHLSRYVQNEGGIAVILGDDIVSPPATIDCKPKRVSMVIDDTGSMGGVIGSVSSALTSFINSSPEDEYTRWSLTTFKDSPTDVGTTEDRDQALSWVNSLSASGGDDCPEDALGGISNGLSALGSDSDTDKQMVVATDASAHGGDVDGIIAAAQASGTRVNVLLTGDCGMSAPAVTTTRATLAADGPPVSSQVVLKRIATETGGKYFFIPGGTTQDFTNALSDIFAGIANAGSTDTQAPTVALSVTPTQIWPPNHKMVEIAPTVTATDNVDPKPAIELVGVQVDQAEDGQGDGHTTGDVQVTPDGRIFVRAERSATGGSRTYTITYRAKDQAGNTGFASATVVVPKNGN